MLTRTPTLVPAVPTFCKCTCFTNSTIVPLGPKPGSDAELSHQRSLFLRSLNPLTDVEPAHAKRAASASCTQCTRAFCLAYNLPICKDAKEKDVVTMCFQRDSRKDMIIVWGFMFGTIGLLAWAAGKRFVESREGQKLTGGGTGGLPGSRGARSGVGSNTENRGNYAPVGIR